MNIGILGFSISPRALPARFFHFFCSHFGSVREMLIVQITWPSGASIKLNTFCLWPLNETSLVERSVFFTPPVEVEISAKGYAHVDQKSVRSKSNKRRSREKFNQFARDMIILCFYLFMVPAFYFILFCFYSFLCFKKRVRP